MKGVPIKKRVFRPAPYEGRLIIGVEETLVEVWLVREAVAGSSRQVRRWFAMQYKPTMATVTARALISLLEADVIDGGSLPSVLKALDFSGPDDREPPSEAP